MASNEDLAFLRGLVQNGFLDPNQADRCTQVLDQRSQSGERVTALQVAVDLGLVDPRRLEAEVKNRSSSRAMPAVQPANGRAPSQRFATPPGSQSGARPADPTNAPTRSQSGVRPPSQRVAGQEAAPPPSPGSSQSGRLSTQAQAALARHQDPARTDSQRFSRPSGDGLPRAVPSSSGDGLPRAVPSSSGDGLPRAVAPGDPARTDSRRIPRPGTSSSSMPAAPLPPEPELVDYEPVAQLGTGPIGPSYLARRRVDGAEVVLKVISPRFQEHPEIWDQIRRDLGTWSKYEAPGAAGPLGAGTLAGKRVAVYPKLAGTTLEQTLAKDGPIQPKQAMQVVQLLARSLIPAHGKNQGVGDVRASKVYWDGQRAVLTDLGLTRAACLAAGFGQYGMTFGHPAYLAPEVLQENQTRPTPAADVYALGILLYQLVTGRLPYQGSSQEMLTQHLEAPIPPPPPGKYQISMALAGLILRLTAKSPAQRVPDARKTVEALQALLERMPDAPLPATSKKPSGEAQRLLLAEALAEPLAPEKKPSGEKPGAAVEEFDPTRSLVSEAEWGALAKETESRPSGKWDRKRIAEPQKVGPKDWDEASVDEANAGVALELKTAVAAAMAAQEGKKTGGRQASARMVSGSAGGRLDGSQLAAAKWGVAIVGVLVAMVALGVRSHAPAPAPYRDPGHTEPAMPVAQQPAGPSTEERARLKKALEDYAAEVKGDADASRFARALQQLEIPPGGLERAPEAPSTFVELRVYVYDKIDAVLCRQVERDFYDLVRVGELDAAEKRLAGVAEWAKTRPAYEVLRQQLERIKRANELRVVQTAPPTKGAPAEDPLDVDRARTLVMNLLEGAGGTAKLYPSRGIVVSYDDATLLFRDLAFHSGGALPRLEAAPGGLNGVRIPIKGKPTLILHKLPVQRPIDVTVELMVSPDPEPAKGCKVALLCGLAPDKPDGVGIAWGFSPVSYTPSKGLQELNSAPTPKIVPKNRLRVEMTLDPSGLDRRWKLSGSLTDLEKKPPVREQEGAYQVTDEDLVGRVGLYVEGCEVWVVSMEIRARLDPVLLEKKEKTPPQTRQPATPRKEEKVTPPPEKEKKETAPSSDHKPR